MAMVTGSRRRSKASPTVASICLLKLSNRVLMHWNMARCRSFVAASTSCQKSLTCTAKHAILCRHSSACLDNEDQAQPCVLRVYLAQGIF